MKNKNEIAKILQSLAETLNDMTDTEYDQFLNGMGYLKFFSSKKNRKKCVKSNSRASVEELETLATHLRDSKTRGEAKELLYKDPRIPLKENLGQLARLLKVHVNKHDTRDAVEEKIIQSVVGVKLRSEAIQGLSLKGGTSQETA
ncbi:MAG: hypothetical protein C4527_23695 [Candidatus Omnitrophota bacterium]|jgi:type I restriction-modification system DNA methylase subunit|nr:MAG: hypothetical protein C4527_23695 [Candidatus Omnitrophota bacterium]